MRIVDYWYSDVKDLLAVTGAALLIGGCYWAYPPAGVVAGGLLLLGISLARHYRGAK